MLIARSITAAILLGACLAAMFLLPNGWWSAVLLGVMLMAAWEWGALAGYDGGTRWLFCATMLVLAAALGWAVIARGTPAAHTGIELAIYAGSCAFWALIAPAWLVRRWPTPKPVLAGAVGLVILLPAWLALAQLQVDPAGLLQMLGIVWIADTAAYLAGSRWGRHKLAPQISPGKTWEGVAGAAAAVAVYYVVLSASGLARPWAAGWHGGLLFAGVTAMSIIGDLLESWMKRRAGVKDSGALLPGHGGILDRIDGLMSSMPLAALIIHHVA